MVIEADERTSVVVTDASRNIQDHEALDIKRVSQRIPEGRTRVTFATERPRHAAVTVSTNRGLVGLSPGDGVGFFSRAAAWVDVRIAALFALIGASGGTILGIWALVSREAVDVDLVDPEGD